MVRKKQFCTFLRQRSNCVNDRTASNVNDVYNNIWICKIWGS